MILAAQFKRMSMLKKDIFDFVVVPKQNINLYIFIRLCALHMFKCIYPALHLIYLLSIRSKNQSICTLFSHYIDYSEKFASYTITISTYILYYIIFGGVLIL